RGEVLLASEHEKTEVEFLPKTVLERGFISPAITLAPETVKAGLQRAKDVLAALGLSEGGYHVELRVNGRGEWDVIEVNARLGGGLLAESIKRQYGRVMHSDWLDMLAGSRPEPYPATRQCGVYLQF